VSLSARSWVTGFYLTCTFTGAAYLFYVDQAIFATGAKLHALGSIAVVDDDFTGATALLTHGTYSNNASATTATTGWHQEASIPWSYYIRC